MVSHNKEVFLRDTVYQAVADGACPTVTSILVKKRTGVPHNDKKLSPGINEIDLDESLRSAESVPCEAVPMPSEAPLYLMYTSGSTGTPKGLVHTTGGFLCHQSLGMRHAWDIRDGDILGCVADIGWQVGHSMTIYGALVNGGTGFLFESTPVYVCPNSMFIFYSRLKIFNFFILVLNLIFYEIFSRILDVTGARLNVTGLLIFSLLQQLIVC